MSERICEVEFNKGLQNFVLKASQYEDKIVFDYIKDGTLTRYLSTPETAILGEEVNISFCDNMYVVAIKIGKNESLVLKIAK